MTKQQASLFLNGLAQGKWTNDAIRTQYGQKVIPMPSSPRQRRSCPTDIDVPLFDAGRPACPSTGKSMCGVVYEFKTAEINRPIRRSREKRALRLYLTAGAWLIASLACGVAWYGQWQAVALMAPAITAGILLAKEAGRIRKYG